MHAWTYKSPLVFYRTSSPFEAAAQKETQPKESINGSQKRLGTSVGKKGQHLQQQTKSYVYQSMDWLSVGQLASTNADYLRSGRVVSCQCQIQGTVKETYVQFILRSQKSFQIEMYCARERFSRTNINICNCAFGSRLKTILGHMHATQQPTMSVNHFFDSLVHDTLLLKCIITSL